MARGFDATTAHTMALRALDGVVRSQATLLSYNRVFLVAGASFLLVLPLLAFLKVPKEGPRKPGPTATAEPGHAVEL
jgi:hypothetical protein